MLTTLLNARTEQRAILSLFPAVEICWVRVVFETCSTVLPFFGRFVGMRARKCAELGAENDCKRHDAMPPDGKSASVVLVHVVLVLGWAVPLPRMFAFVALLATM